jgi:hypothetical protein
MTDALTRIIEYPHSPVFDKDPKAALALRVRHPAGLVLEVAGGVLRLTSDGAVVEYSLTDKTIGELADELRDDGYDVVFENQELASRSAHILLAGTRSQDQSNGDHLLGHTSLLWALYGAYSVELDEAEYQVGEALRQMVMTQAEGEWLDVWSGLYGVPRRQGEPDSDLQTRIPEEIFRLRVNGLAIEKAVHDLTGRTVEIREPWKRIFSLSESALSGADHLHDGTYYTYHVIHPVSRSAFDWSDVLAVIRRNKAAGVEVYSPAVEFPVSHITVQPPVEYLVERAAETLQVFGAWPGGENPLGVMRLSDNEFTLNHRAMIYQLRTYSNEDGLQTEQYIGLPRNIAYASITLSDGVPLGDENAILSRGQMHIEYDPQPVVSDTLALSDLDVTREIRRVEFVTIDGRGAYLLWGFETTGDSSRHETRIHSASAYDGMNVWSGLWDSRTWYGWRLVGMKALEGPMATGVSADSGESLGDMALSDSEFIFNHPMMITHESA